MTFIKDFINVLSGSSVSFLLLTFGFAFIVYFNMLDGRIRSKTGGAFLGFGILLVVVGIAVTPLLYLGIAYLLLLFGCAHMGGRLWDRKVGLWLLIFAAGGFGLS